ncbi:MAG: hypothetical protein QXH73_01230 [Ignisphaera sp.]
MDIEKKLYRASIALLATIVFAVILRVTPTTVYNQPFSTDVWPLIKVSRTIVENPEVRIWMDDHFDGYNNRWPGLPISIAIYSLVTGTNVETIYRYLYVIVVTSIQILSIYLLMNTVNLRKGVAIAITLYYVSTPSLALFSSSILKEVYAHVFLYLILLTMVVSIERRRIDFATYFILFLLFITISTTHHFTSLLTLEFMISTILIVMIYYIIEKPKKREDVWKGFKLFISSSSIFAIVFALYYFIYGGYGFRYRIAVEDIALYVFYTLFVYISYALVIQLGIGKTSTLSITSIVIFMTVAIIVYSLAYGVTFERIDIVPYIVPLAIPLPLFCFLPKEMDIDRALVLGIATALSINIMYIYFSRPELMEIFHRILNYLPLMSSFLMGYIVSRIRNSILKIFIFFIVSITVLMNVISVYNIVLGRDRTIFYWIYRESEVHSLNYMYISSIDNTKILGDAKVFYFMGSRRSVYPLALINYLYTNRSYRDSLVILYRDNFDKGYAISLTIHNIKSMVMYINTLNRVYDCRTVLGLLMR